MKNFTGKISVEKFHLKNFTQKISPEKSHLKNFTVTTVTTVA